MAYSINVEKFFEKYNSDEELRKRVQSAVDMYPGSLEIRECLVEDTLLPIAESEGLPFTLEDLRKYETRLKMSKSLDVEIDPDEPEDETIYWLIDRGWTNDESIFKSAAPGGAED